MASLVIELQCAANDPEESITNLLRKAYVVARKLKVVDFEEWINCELNGYQCELSEIPSYRKLSGDLRGWNPYNGWIPIIVDDEKIADMVHNRTYTAPISGLESILSNGGKVFGLPFGNENRKQLSEWIDYDTNFMTRFGRSQGVSLIEAVRTAVLEWSLKLEEEGILGEEMRFTEDEKVKAQSAISITNIFQGDVSNSQIQQCTNDSTQNMTMSEDMKNHAKELLKNIEDNLSELNLVPEHVAEIEHLVRAIDEEARVAQPCEGFIRESFSSIRRILEGASGGVLGAGLIHMINAVLS